MEQTKLEIALHNFSTEETRNFRKDLLKDDLKRVGLGLAASAGAGASTYWAATRKGLPKVAKIPLSLGVAGATALPIPFEIYGRRKRLNELQKQVNEIGVDNLKNNILGNEIYRDIENGILPKPVEEYLSDESLLEIANNHIKREKRLPVDNPIKYENKKHENDSQTEREIAHKFVKENQIGNLKYVPSVNMASGV